MVPLLAHGADVTTEAIEATIFPISANAGPGVAEQRHEALTNENLVTELTFEFVEPNLSGIGPDAQDI